jgi:hypothetical protein
MDSLRGKAVRLSAFVLFIQRLLFRHSAANYFPKTNKHAFNCFCVM